jgi:D-alanine-D-alanine ligase
MSKNLIVAYGGVSPEHEVSVLTAMQVMAVLEESDYEIVPLYISKSGKWLTGEALSDLSRYKDLKKLEQQCALCHFRKDGAGITYLSEQGGGLFSKPNKTQVHAVFCAFHGGEGENGSFQGLCEQFNLPYTGSGVMASSVGMDKVSAKRLCTSAGISVTRWVDFLESEWVKNEDSLIDEMENLGYPLIVKPVHLGSSIGVVKAENRVELQDAIETAFRYDQHVLVEEAVQPLMEINCSVLGDAENFESSVCERPLGKSETLSFEDKYQSGGGSDKGMASADRVIPADIPDELTSEIQELSGRIFKLFNASGVARLDFLLNSDNNKVYFNEINTIPGSFSFYLWEKSGLDFKSLVNKLIDIGLRNHHRKNGRIRSYETNLLSEKAATGIKGLKGK